MPAKPMEPPKPAADAAKGAEAKPAAEAGAKSGKGLGAWIPLIAALILMPVIAYAMTTFVLVPKLKKSLSSESEEPAAASGSHGKAKAESGKAGSAKEGKKEEAKKSEGKKEEAKKSEGKKEEAKKGEGKKTAEAGGKVKVPLDKIFATIAGSQGSRYLLAKMTLVGPDEEFKDKVDENHDQLIDAAIGVFSSKTLQDIEKAGFQNTIKTELIQALNHAMGEDSVQDIYFVELATQ